MTLQSWLDVPAPLRDDPATFRARYLPEYRTRLLAIYRACDGWSRAAVEPLWVWVEFTSDCFEREALDAWRASLTELERYTGAVP